MDTQKLLAILNDIVTEHEANNPAPLLSELQARLAENTQESFQQAEELEAQLLQLFDSSKTNDYSPSEARLLESLGGSTFAGLGGKKRLQTLFEGSTLQLQAGLQQYLTDYSAFIEKATQLRNALSGLDIPPYVREAFEVGFVFPNDLDNLQDIVTKLNIWDRFLVMCSDIAGSEDNVTRLSRVSNGSFDFFVLKDPNVAEIVTMALSNVYVLYMAMKKIQKAQLEVENLEIDQEIKNETLASLKKAESQKREVFSEEVTATIFNEKYKGPAERKNELSEQFAVAFKVILKYMQQGVEVEVANPSADKGDSAKPVVAEVKTTNRELRELYAEPLEQRRLVLEVKVTAGEIKKVSTAPRTSKPEATVKSSVAKAPVKKSRKKNK